MVFSWVGLEGNAYKNPLFGLSNAFIEIQGGVEEPMTRFELVTSSLPRKRSTPELHRRKKKRERETGFEPATFSLEG